MKKWQKEITDLLSDNFCLKPNGHGLFKPEIYYKLGFPIEFVDQFIKDFESDDSYVGTIFTKGERREVLTGVVYNLDFLYGILELLCIQYTNQFGSGRGDQAREIVELVKEKLGK